MVAVRNRWVPRLEWAVGLFSSHAVGLLTPVLVLFSLAVSAIAFAYPLEIETRESTLWLHAAALKAGVNIFNDSQVAFINTHHGPFDSLFKAALATALPFLEPWHVTRMAVLFLPAVFLLVGWIMVPRSSRETRGSALFFGSIGYLFLVVTAKEFLFVGRSDATVALFFVPLLAVTVAVPAAGVRRTLLQGVASGLLGAAVALSNWRTTPVVLGVVVFALWRCLRLGPDGRRQAGVYVGGCAAAAVAALGAVILCFFDGDVVLYYRHFFGFYTDASGWGHDEYGGPFARFALSLFNPTAPPKALKGGPVLLALGTYALIWRAGGSLRVAWTLLGGFAFAMCTVPYFLNYWGGGAWYYITFLIVLWGHLATVYARLPLWKRSLLGAGVLVLILINLPTVVRPTLHRVSTFRQAGAFMRDLRSLDRSATVLSEDCFFFRRAYAGELIDMGDIISIVHRSGYYGAGFDRIVERHFARLRIDPPDYVVTGFTASPELRAVLKKQYIQVAEGPDNFTANARGRMRLLRRVPSPRTATP